MIDLNETYQEEGFEVLDFNTFSLLEKHGVLSGDKSCSKFASHLMDFMEMLDQRGVEYGVCILHSNEYSPEHIKNVKENIPDFSNSSWDLPEWATWELVFHYGEYDDNDNTNASMAAHNMCAHLYTKSAKVLKKVGRTSYSATIQHEMKHYFDRMIEFSQQGKNNKDLTREVNRLGEVVDHMKDDDSTKNITSYFQYFFYATSENEMSAWLEQSRDLGRLSKWAKDNNYVGVAKGKDSDFSIYKKLLEAILVWKDDESQRDQINDKVVNLGNIKSYDEFKKFMMDTFGTYLELRFGQKASFEKYIKGYIKILDKQIKKHSKIWADGYQGIDLDEDPNEVKDILIKKREERLERIRKKKEEKK